MSETNKKRSNSFRKLFPRLLFSSRSKEKINKDAQIAHKHSMIDNNSSISNQYENPRVVKDNADDNGCIYENLAVRYDNDIDYPNNITSSNNSSSSTLVSESVKSKPTHKDNVTALTKHEASARPQVPRKPYNDKSTSPLTNDVESYQSKEQYPDVYYHSVEKLTETKTPLDEIKLYRAVESYTKPASVGAEIKRVSTKFLISPKKEAEVRTIQPIRARSLSFDNNKEKSIPEPTYDKKLQKREGVVKKSYNYSAPTSPIPANHKIPNMPKTISPYGHVRKSMNEAEEKKNSLSRTSSRNQINRTGTPTGTYERNIIQNDNIATGNAKHKDKARQKLEAFYWQKLRELKQREDEYLLKQSFTPSLKSTSSNYTPQSYKNLSLPCSFKTNSLPRDVQFTSESPYTSSKFVRGAPERKTDSFTIRKGRLNNDVIIYRHPEKLQCNENIQLNVMEPSKLQRQEARCLSVQPKRVSFEEQLYGNGNNKVEKNVCAVSLDHVSGRTNRLSIPPRPPVRSTSVGRSGGQRSFNPASANYLPCSESESGSEAGEIKRILQNRAPYGGSFEIQSIMDPDGHSTF